MFKEGFRLKDIFINEGDNYKNVMEKDVLPYLNTIMEDGKIDGENGIGIYYRKYIVKDSIGNIVISHGFGEFIEKYTEVIYYFTKSKYNVFIMEHRGHGRSGKLGLKDETQVSVENFDCYVKDLKKFIDEVVTNYVKDNLFLFSHSMGGAISTKFLIDYPEYFDAAVLESPMMTINTGSSPEFAADILARGAVLLGRGCNYAPGNGPYDPEHIIENSGTSSVSRFDFLHGVEIDNKPIQRGGPSLKWLKEAIKATRYITNKKNVLKVKIPVLLFQAGQDSFVKPEGQNKFAQYAESCKITRVPESKHEIFRESDYISKQFMENVLDFYYSNNKKSE